MAAIGKEAWFALMNRKSWAAACRSPERTRPRLLTEYRAPAATACSHAEAGSTHHARPRSDREPPPPGGPRFGQPGRPTREWSGRSAQTRGQDRQDYGQRGPGRPSVGEIPANTVGVFLASAAPLAKASGCPPNRVNPSPDELVKLVHLLKRTPLQSEWWRRTAEVVTAEKLCCRDKVTCDEPVDDIEDEKGDNECLCALADQDDDRGVEKPTIDIVERGLDRENAQRLLGAPIHMKNWKFSVHIRIGLMGAGRHHHRVGAIGGLAHFDEADVRQLKNPVDLQLELARVQVPEPFAEAATIAALDLGDLAIDRSDVASVVEVELQQCEEQSDRGAEQEHPGEKAQPDTAVPAVEAAPCCPDPCERRRSALGLAVILAGVCRLMLHHASLAAPGS